MTLIEFLSFIITMLLVIYLSSRRAVQNRKNQLSSDSYDEEGQDNIQEMIRLLNLSPENARTLERELKGEPAPPPPPKKALMKRPLPPQKKMTARTLSDQYTLHTNIEDFKQHSKVAEKKYGSNIDHRYDKPPKPIASESVRIASNIDPYAIKYKNKSRITKLLDSLESKKDMILIHEILNRPKALKDDKIRWRQLP